MGELEGKATGFHRAIMAVMLSILALVCVALAAEIWFSSASQYKVMQNGEAIQKAQNKKLEHVLIESGEEYKIDCFWLNYDHCRRFIRRIANNPNLLTAFREAKKGNVAIFPGDRFHIGSRWVSVDINKSDEEILKFLR